MQYSQQSLLSEQMALQFHQILYADKQCMYHFSTPKLLFQQRGSENLREFTLLQLLPVNALLKTEMQQI